MSLNDINNQINAIGIGGDLTSEVTGTNGKFSLAITSAAANSDIKLSNTGVDNNVLSDLAFGNRSYKDELQTAEDASIDINGITGITSSSNTFSEAVDGMTFNLNPEAEINSTATVSVTKDTGKATKAVQGFVDQYNSVMSFIDGKTDYDSEEDKGAILQGDSKAMRLQMRLRELVTSRVKENGDYQSLYSIGIEVDRDGVMSIDNSHFLLLQK